MELYYECRKCKHKWVGGLYDDVCLHCKNKDVRILSTDEDYSEYNYQEENSYDECDY